MNPERKYAPAERESHDQPANDNAISGVHKIDRVELTRKLHAAEARQAEEKRKREEAEDAVEKAFMDRGDEITDAAKEGIALTPTETEKLGEANNEAHIEATNAAEIAELKAELAAMDERNENERQAELKRIEGDVEENLKAGLEYKE